MQLLQTDGAQLKVGDILPIQGANSIGDTTGQRYAYVFYTVIDDAGAQRFFSTGNGNNNGSVRIDRIVGRRVNVTINNARMSSAPFDAATFVLNGTLSVPNVTGAGLG